MDDDRRIYWADFHNHNEIGYATGTLDRSYRIARASLDAFAFTPHGWWADPPEGDPQLRDYHVAGAERVNEQFSRVIEAANQSNEPGTFVSLLAFEWHSLQWGDYVVLFPGESAVLHRADTLEELQHFAREAQALLIPHHVAYAHGSRGTHWPSVNPQLTPVVETFSEHGNSLEEQTRWPMLAHSMGGPTRSQTVMHQLVAGRRFGFVGSSDNHHGYPASYGEGVTGLYADELTRRGVFDALRRRRTFVCTGDRIAMAFYGGDGFMGDELPASAARTFHVRVDPLAPLDSVVLIKNGGVAHRWEGPPIDVPSASADPLEHLVRVDWGWGRMDHRELTRWRIEVTAACGTLVGAIGCFGGGPASSELINLATLTHGRVCIDSFTSRRNPRPINAVVLRVHGNAQTRLTVAVETDTEGEKGGCTLTATLGDLVVDDVHGQILRRFSSPRLRIGRPYACKSLQLTGSWTDPSPGFDDFYLVKAQQRNGQTAWSSPIWFGRANSSAPQFGRWDRRHAHITAYQ